MLKEKHDMKTIADIMTRQVESISQNENVQKAAQMMRDANVGILPVTDGNQLLGVITDRDICMRVVAEGREPSITYVQQVMTKDVVTCPPETEIREAIEMMTRKQIRRLMIVDQNRQLVGVVAQADVARDESLDKETERLVEGVSQ